MLNVNFHRRRIFTWLWPAVIVAGVIVFTFVVVRPFDDDQSNYGDDIASAWSEGIGRLGLTAVFPPEEDFYVGDIFAVVADEDKKSNLLGRAARIGHLDLTEAILKARTGRPVFPDTAELANGQHFRHQPEEALSTGDTSWITLSLVSFPGIRIRTKRNTTSALSLAYFGANAGRDFETVEEISIPVAETYGTDPSEALDSLKQWCINSDTREFCTDEYARELLAYSIDPGLLNKNSDGNYIHKINIMLVNKVYLTREIDERQSLAIGRTAEGHAPLAVISAPNEMTLQQQAGSDETPQVAGPHPTKEGSMDTTRSGALTWANSAGTEIRLQQVFQRPLVFGFRSVEYSVTPASATKTDKTK